MVEIPATRWKLGEAEFFYSHLATWKKGSQLVLERDHFDFYVSAFLSAARSVTWVLQVEYKDLYDNFYPNFEQALSKKDRNLLKFMNGQRIAAVHRRGPNIKSKIEFISMTKLKPDYQGHPAYYPVLCAPPGTPPPEIGQMVYSFDMGGASEDFFEICRQYLDILTKLLEEFEKQNP